MHYYHYRDNELYDQEGGNYGVSFGATLTTDNLGNPANAYYFNGSNSYIQTIRPMRDLTNGTFSLWFNANIIGKNETLLCDAEPASSNYCKIVLVSDGSAGSSYKRHYNWGIYIVANKNGAGNGGTA